MEDIERNHLYFRLSSTYDTFKSMSMALDNKIKIAIKETLKSFPDQTANFPFDPAFAIVENDDEQWFETGIFGIRNRNGVLEYSLDTVINEKGDEVTSWNKRDVRNEHDHYSTANWLSILESLKDYFV